ncbi:aldehyde dehydrogenase family protein [Sphingomonas sp. 35-24ZXX]|uniref:aldehyde dehydrogenase family protein n=1 Tax=Sphingomonas sp. 35-24ZXX TaxID=1545915 RepID=UPI0009E087F2|nr:aldehyde dehydrogenase family protein [Sphingomonas sp. 35-24ZXX]
MSDAISFDTFKLAINGWLEDASGSFAVVNPATEAVIAQAPDCSAEQLDKAVAAARKAFRSWKVVPLAERAEMLRAAAARLTEYLEPLTALLTYEHGKPLADARAEIQNAARWFNAFADIDLPVERRPEPNGRVAEIRRVPVGVVGAIAPWNFPVSLAAWKLAPALLAGNTVVLKPSPFTPLTTLKIGELLLDLFPAGVLNTIAGSDHLGPLMSGHPDIDKIAFTGSTATGKAVMRGAAGTLKRLTLELGGNDPAIVLPDADVDAVAERLFWGAFANAGQICVAAKRVYVHDSIYDRFAAKMAELARNNPPAPGDAAGTRIGPVQNRQQFERVKAMIEEARNTGLRLISDPGAMTGPGYFIAPTIVDNPPEDAPVVKEEPFGPLLPLLRYTDIADAIARANDSEYGLASSVWSADPDKAAEVGRQLEAGTVWINTILGITPSLPFGGHKQSGIGVENSEAGLHEYTNLQVIIR